MGLLEHQTRPTKLCVCVDDFGVKYFNKEDANHLLDSISKHYHYTTAWEGKNYCRLIMDWHYPEGYVDISMPNYVPDSLKRLNHVPKVHPQYSPHENIPIQYGTQGPDNMHLLRIRIQNC